MRNFHLYTQNPVTLSWVWMPHPGTDSADAFQRAEREGFAVKYGPQCSVVLSSDASRKHYALHS